MELSTRKSELGLRAEHGRYSLPRHADWPRQFSESSRGLIFREPRGPLPSPVHQVVINGVSVLVRLRDRGAASPEFGGHVAEDAHETLTESRIL